MKIKCTACGGTGKVNAVLPELKAGKTDRQIYVIIKSWHHSSEKPATPGVYKTANMNSFHFGHAYSKWDGEKWCVFFNWGGSHNAPEFLWQGEGRSTKKPITDTKVLERQY